jgi:hypothetical protein
VDWLLDYVIAPHSIKLKQIYKESSPLMHAGTGFSSYATMDGVFIYMVLGMRKRM